MSNKGSFEEAQDLPENCGVECNPYDYFQSDANNYNEEFGEYECEEDDEECLYQSLLRSQKQAKLSLANASSLRRESLPESSYQKGLESDNAENESRTSPDRNAYRPVFPEVADTAFEGIPPNYSRKNYKPDYPADLQMKQICTSKSLKKRTIGTTRTHPKAVFIPSVSTVSRLDNTSAKKSGAKGSFASSLRASMAKGDAENSNSLDEPSPLEENRQPPPIVSSSDEVVVDWLEDHNIQMMFEYFLGLCVIHQPQDPWTFISQLAGKMMEARTDIETFDVLPRILTPDHTEAIFRIYDRIENGWITNAQYKSAMEAMGLNRFNMSPDGWEENSISKDTFVMESTEAINDLLRSFMVFQDQPVEDSSPTELPKTESLVILDSGSLSGTGSGSSAGDSSSDKSRINTGSELAINMDNSVPLSLNYDE